MRLRDLPSLLGEIARIRPYTVQGQGDALTLEDLLSGYSVEDVGLFRSRLFEHSSRPLLQRLPLPRKRPRVEVVGVDSSSRLLETPSHSIVITVASASSRSIVELYDYPEVYGYPVSPGGGPPFIAVVPGDDYGHPLTGRGPGGWLYGPGYSVEAVMDEWRVALENWVLGEVLPVALEEGLLHGAVVLLDGPLTPAPWRIQEDGWSQLSRARSSAVGRLEDLGVPVIGVVKRVERSRILSTTPGLRDMVGDCTGVQEQGDRALIHMLQESRCSTRSPGRLLVTPRIIVEPRVPGALEKIVEYLVVPPGRWQDSSRASRVYRLEYSRESLEMLNSRGLEPHHVIALDSIARGGLEPVTIRASDRRSRGISKALRLLVARGLRLQGMPVSYSSEVDLRS